MSNDIRDIIERLAILEGRITPTTVKHGLNPQQKSVKQLPALFKPKDISPTLSKPPYQKHPMDGWLVGEETDENKEVVEEAKVDEEKLLDKVKKSLTDYLASVEEKLEKKIDKELSDKPKNHELGKRDKTDRDLVVKDKNTKKSVSEDPTQELPANTDKNPTEPVIDPTYAVSSPGAVKTMTMEDGRVCEIHGDERTGFEIRHGNRRLKSRFKNIDEATMAFEMFCARMRKNNPTADYIDEA